MFKLPEAKERAKGVNMEKVTSGRYFSKRRLAMSGPPMGSDLGGALSDLGGGIAIGIGDEEEDLREGGGRAPNELHKMKRVGL